MWCCPNDEANVSNNHSRSERHLQHTKNTQTVFRFFLVVDFYSFLFVNFCLGTFPSRLSIVTGNKTRRRAPSSSAAPLHSISFTCLICLCYKHPSTRSCLLYFPTLKKLNLVYKFLLQEPDQLHQALHSPVLDVIIKICKAEH